MQPFPSDVQCPRSAAGHGPLSALHVAQPELPVHTGFNHVPTRPKKLEFKFEASFQVGSTRKKAYHCGTGIPRISAYLDFLEVLSSPGPSSPRAGF
jgi:hypothetical protein